MIAGHHLGIEGYGGVMVWIVVMAFIRSAVSNIMRPDSQAQPVIEPLKIRSLRGVLVRRVCAGETQNPGAE